MKITQNDFGSLGLVVVICLAVFSGIIYFLDKDLSATFFIITSVVGFLIPPIATLIPSNNIK